MKQNRIKLWTLVLAVALLAACRAEQPSPAPSTILENDSARMETARLDLGLVDLCYTGGRDVRVKAQISAEGKPTYNYDLNNRGEWETFSFPLGDGTYTVKVLENTTGNRYQPIFNESVDIALADPNSPFLHPNQFVNYAGDSETVKKAGEVMAAGETDADKTALAFDYVVDAIAYDHEKADTVKNGYLPDVDAILEGGKGICFDYAAVLTAMLRSQGIPCKLMVGYAGAVYHAWVEVWCENDGLVDGAIPITGEEWSLLDPTFVSSGERSGEILGYVTKPGNYEVRYIY